jgi:hypothetical protein
MLPKICVTNGGKSQRGCDTEGVAGVTHGNMYFPEHVDTLSCVDQRDILRCRDDYSTFKSIKNSSTLISSVPLIVSKSFDMPALLTVHYDQLTETQLHVTSSRRHVDDQNLEIPSR